MCRVLGTSPSRCIVYRASVNKDFYVTKLLYLPIQTIVKSGVNLYNCERNVAKYIKDDIL